MLKGFLVLILCIPIVVYGKDWENASLTELDSEQFRRLEQSEDSLEEIPKIIISRSGKKSSIFLINAYTVLGIINKNKGFYVSALNYHLLALSSAKRLDDRPRISACLNNIGTLYLLQENYSKAIDYFNLSLDIEETTKALDQKSIRLYNLGEAYTYLKQYDEGLSYFTSSLLLEKQLKNGMGVAYALLGQARVYAGLKRTSDLRNAINQIEFNDLDEEGKIDYYLVSGKSFDLENKAEQAIATWLNGVAQANKSGTRTKLAELYLLIAETYEKLGNASKSAAYYKKHIYLYKTLQSNQIKNQLEDLTYQNELKEKELQIVYLKKQKEIESKNKLASEKLRAFDWKIVLISIVSLICIVVTTVIAIKRVVRVKA